MLLIEERKDELDGLNDTVAVMKIEKIPQDDGEVDEELKENAIDQLNVQHIAPNNFAEDGDTEYL